MAIGNIGTGNTCTLATFNKMLARVFAGAVMAVMVLMPGDAFAFLGLFESKPTKAEMERMDVLFNGYYKAPDAKGRKPPLVRLR